MFGKRRMERGSGSFRVTQDLRRSIAAKKNQKTNGITTARTAPRFAKSEQVIDARKKLQQRKLKTSAGTRPIQKQEGKTSVQSRKRSLDFSDGSLKVTTREEIRSATVSGGSIQIVAKVGANAVNPPVDFNDEETGFSPPGKSRRPMSTNLQITTKNPNWREEQPTLESLDLSSIFPETEEVDIVEMVEERLRNRNSSRSRATPRPAPGTKIIITNLHPSVSHQDIEELFGVVGELKACKLIRPGAAEVVYTNKEDAQNAYVRYHKRKLDGQPMMCRLASATTAAADSANQAGGFKALHPLRSPPPTYSAKASTPRVPSSKEHSTDHSSRPVVFKVRI